MIEAFLEQFQILLLIPLKSYRLNFSITNFLCLFSIVFIIYCNNSNFEFGNYKEDSFYLILSNWQKSFEILTEISAQLLHNITTK
jgi:hypothetical protein